MDFDQTWYILSLKRIWNPIDLQGHRVKFLGEGIRHALRFPCFVLLYTHNCDCQFAVNLFQASNKFASLIVIQKDFNKHISKEPICFDFTVEKTFVNDI